MTNKKISLLHDYTQFESGFQQSLSFDLTVPIFISKNDPVRLLNEILEGLDYTNLYQTYSSNGRNYSVPPIIMFKILIYAYMNRSYSSRDIAHLCRRDINFIWLLQGYKSPSHHTIARFRSERLADEVMQDLFDQLIVALFDLDEIKFKNLFIDGSKFEANANRYTFVWKKTVVKNLDKLMDKIKKLIDSFNELYLTSHEFKKDSILEVLTKCLDYLNQQVIDQNIVFVSGKGRRKTLIQKQIEQIKEYVDKFQQYQTYLTDIGDQRSSKSKTDNDATFFRMKEDHMKNGQLKPGYNVQIGVESEYIVGVGIFQKANDVNTLIPFLTSLEERFNRKIKNIIADAGYENEENYVHLKTNEQTTYIKPLNYEQMKTAAFKKQIGRVENMDYDEETDTYTCANGKKLSVVGVFKRKTKTDYEREVTMYECEDCKGCPLRQNCTKAKEENNKKIEVSKKMLELRKESLANITSEEGNKLRTNRSIQVEGAFGVIKEDYGFRKFLTRGKIKITVEFLLIAFAYNVKKLHNKIQKNRLGHELHEKEAA